MANPRSPRQWMLALPIILFALPRLCLAHTTGLSTSELAFGTNGLRAEVLMAGADLILALAQLEKEFAASPGPGDGKTGAEKVSAEMEWLRKFASDGLVVEFDGRAIRPGTPKLALDEKDNFHIELNYAQERPARLRVKVRLFEHLPADHMNFLSVHDADGKLLGNKMLKPGDDVFQLECPAGAGKAEPQARTFTDFLKLGVEHIWTGYDHLLFLLALLLVCQDFKSAVSVVSFFTLAHSITLAFATLNLVSVSSRVVEPAIAASIVYVGVENFVRRDGPKGRWLITFLFGLIHGFGFASVLRDMGVASSTTGVAVPLVAFNLGVELGQIAIAAVLLPVIWKLRKWLPFLRWGVPACSAIVAAAGSFWFVQRVFFT